MNYFFVFVFRIITAVYKGVFKLRGLFALIGKSDNVHCVVQENFFIVIRNEVCVCIEYPMTHIYLYLHIYTRVRVIIEVSYIRKFNSFHESPDATQKLFRYRIITNDEVFIRSR